MTALDLSTHDTLRACLPEGWDAVRAWRAGDCTRCGAPYNVGERVAFGPMVRGRRRGFACSYACAHDLAAGRAPWRIAR